MTDWRYMPVILVSDFEENPPVTTKYTLRNNELDFEKVYVKVNQLCDHAGRGRLEAVGAGASPDFHLRACSDEFRELFWDCCSSIADYFTDFLPADSAAMQSVWFHLLDKLQEAAILPHYYWLPDVPSCDHAEAFVKDFEYFKGILNVLANPKPDALLEPVSSAGHLTDARCNVSHMGNKEGLKRWQQFLYKDSPGFIVPAADRVYSNTERGLVPGPKDAVRFDGHIPWIGLAIIGRYTARIREAAEAALEDEPDPRVKASALAEFDSKTLNWKRTSVRVTIDGRQVLNEPMYPKPESTAAPRRRSTLSDANFHNRHPSLALVNEYIGFNKEADFFRYRNLDENFEMLGFRTLPGPSAPSRIDPATYCDMFDDWADIVHY